jgi:hypothetical protein
MPPSTIDPIIYQWVNAIIDPNTGASMEYWHLIKSPKDCTAWECSFANELDQLAQGIEKQEKGTNTIFFIEHHKVPPD